MVSRERQSQLHTPTEVYDSNHSDEVSTVRWLYNNKATAQLTFTEYVGSGQASIHGVDGVIAQNNSDPGCHSPDPGCRMPGFDNYFAAPPLLHVLLKTRIKKYCSVVIIRVVTPRRR